MFVFIPRHLYTRASHVNPERMSRLEHDIRNSNEPITIILKPIGLLPLQEFFIGLLLLEAQWIAHRANPGLVQTRPRSRARRVTKFFFYICSMKKNKIWYSESVRIRDSIHHWCFENSTVFNIMHFQVSKFQVRILKLLIYSRIITHRTQNLDLSNFRLISQPNGSTFNLLFQNFEAISLLVPSSLHLRRGDVPSVHLPIHEVPCHHTKHDRPPDHFKISELVRAVTCDASITVTNRFQTS